MPKKRVENSLTCVLSLDLFIRTVRKPLKSGLEKGREREREREGEREREREKEKEKEQGPILDQEITFTSSPRSK